MEKLSFHIYAAETSRICGDDVKAKVGSHGHIVLQGFAKLTAFVSGCGQEAANCNWRKEVSSVGTACRKTGAIGMSDGEILLDLDSFFMFMSNFIFKQLKLCF